MKGDITKCFLSIRPNVHLGRRGEVAGWQRWRPQQLVALALELLEENARGHVPTAAQRHRQLRVLPHGPGHEAEVEGVELGQLEAEQQRRAGHEHLRGGA